MTWINLGSMVVTLIEIKASTRVFVVFCYQ